MTDAIVLTLNQQQLEMIDATLERAGVSDREALVRLALREFHSSSTQQTGGTK